MAPPRRRVIPSLQTDHGRSSHCNHENDEARGSDVPRIGTLSIPGLAWVVFCTPQRRSFAYTLAPKPTSAYPAIFLTSRELASGAVDAIDNCGRRLPGSAPPMTASASERGGREPCQVCSWRRRKTEEFIRASRPASRSSAAFAPCAAQTSPQAPRYENCLLYEASRGRFEARASTP